MMKLATQIKNANADCDAFNAKYPVGTRVKYWSGVRGGKPDGETTTRSTASLVSACACVWLEGVRGGIALTHIEVIQ